MSYIALARKWRPRTFSQLVGQDAINKALTQALKRQRLHHAYLFTGTRGVGKTSLARLMAKAMSCEEKISAEPCLNCDTCSAIEKGQFVDLFEIDAASRTRVEDTRDILDNVQYLPTLGRFKIYIIDEVHMLSTHSFNALLKTLEEPPSHVKFILATTDPQKLPATILSRCLQFHLKPMQAGVIVAQLETILTAEACTYEQEALLLLAQAAQGSLRDALSLLDQALAYTETHLTASEVKQLLGYTQQNYALQLLQALAALRPDHIVTICRQIAVEGGHFRYVLDALLGLLHQLAIAQSVKNSAELFTLDKSLDSLKNQFSPEEVQLFYQIGLNGLQDMSLAPSLDMGFEMTLLRMYAFKPASVATPPVLASESKCAAFVSNPAVVEPNTKSVNIICDIDSPASQDRHHMELKEKSVAVASISASDAKVEPSDSRQVIIDTEESLLAIQGIVDTEESSLVTQSIIDTEEYLPAIQGIVDTEESLLAAQSIVDTEESLPATQSIIDTEESLLAIQSIIDTEESLLTAQSMTNTEESLLTIQSSVDPKESLFTIQNSMDVKASFHSCSDERGVTSNRPLVSDDSGVNPEVSSVMKDSPNPDETTSGLSWDQLLQKLGLTGLSHSAAEQAAWGGKSGAIVTLCIDKNHQSIFTPSIKTRIEQSLSAYYQETIRLELSMSTTADQPTPAQQKTILKQPRQEDAQQALATDPVFQALQETFEGRWVGQALDPDAKK